MAWAVPIFSDDPTHKEATMTLKTSVHVHYELVDGWHVFRSEDVDGLYIASPDRERAFNDVAPAIEMLMKLNKGIDCTATSLSAPISSITACTAAASISDN